MVAEHLSVMDPSLSKLVQEKDLEIHAAYYGLECGNVEVFPAV